MTRKPQRPARLKPVAAALLALFAQQAWAIADTIYIPPSLPSGAYGLNWLSNVTGNWSEPGYWSPYFNVAPSPNSYVGIYNYGNPVLDNEATVLGLYMAPTANLSGTGTLHAGSLLWHGGSQMGSGGLVVSGDAALGEDSVNTAVLSLKDGRSLTLNGNSTLQAYSFNLSNGSTVNNNGSFISRGDRRNAWVNDNNISNTGVGNAFNNAGSFIQDAQGHTTTVHTAFNNTGTLKVQSGGLRLIGGGSHLGSFETLAGQSLEFIGSHDFNAGAIINNGLIKFTNGTANVTGLSAYSGNGTIQTTGGTVNLGVVAGMNVGQLKLAGGSMVANAGLGASLGAAQLEIINGSTLSGTADVQVGDLTWVSGHMSGAAATQVSGQAQLGDGINYAPLYLEGGRTLDLAGNSAFQAAFLAVSGASTVNNTGVFTSLGHRRGAQVYDNNVTDANANGIFNNAGSFLQDASGHTTAIATAFNNTGTVRVQSGTLKLNRGGSHAGGFQVLAGQTLDFGGGIHNFTGASSIHNAGTVKFSGGTTNLGANVSYAGDGVFHVAGATVNLSHPAVLTPGQLRISGGSANLDSGVQTSQLVQSGGKLAGAGDVQAANLAWTGGSMAGTGTTRVTGAASLGDGAAYANLAQDGRRLVLSGPTTFQAYQLAMSNGAVLDNQGVFINRGDVRGATVGNNVIVSNTPSAQSVIDNAGSFVQDAAGHSLTIGARFDNRGEVRVDNGRLVFNAAFNQLGDASELDLAVTGLVNSDFDVNATALLDGTLTLRFLGYTPTVGQEIQVFSYNGHTGSFDRISAVGLDAGLALMPVYGTYGLSVQVAAVPEPETWAMLLAGLGLVAAVARRKQHG